MLGPPERHFYWKNSSFCSTGGPFGIFDMTSIYGPIFDRFWSLLASFFFPKSTNIGSKSDLERYRFFDRCWHRILNGPRRPQDAPRRPKTASEGPRRPKTAPRGRQDGPKRLPKNGLPPFIFRSWPLRPPQDTPGPPQDPSRIDFWDDFWSIVGWFLVDFWSIWDRFYQCFLSILDRFLMDWSGRFGLGRQEAPRTSQDLSKSDFWYIVCRFWLIFLRCLVNFCFVFLVDLLILLRPLTHIRSILRSDPLGLRPIFFDFEWIFVSSKSLTLAWMCFPWQG